MIPTFSRAATIDLFFAIFFYDPLFTLEHEQRERVLQDMKADRQLGAEVVKMARNIIQPELSLSAASTSLATSITDGSMVGGSEGDADEDNGIVGMSEQEKRLMGALRATS